LMAVSSTRGSDSPSPLTASTRNKYSSPSCNPVTSNFGGSSSPDTLPIWDRYYDLLKIFCQKIVGKLAFFTQNKAKLFRNLIITLAFDKKAHFCKKNCLKSQENERIGSKQREGVA
jgi:hypothetical protein